MNSINILDCTLRDGGYINDWVFSKEKIQSIITNLNKSRIEYIECGFLKENVYCENKTFFSSISDFEKYIIPNQKYTLMINYGEYNISNFSECKNKNIKIRVAFKKNNQKEALEYIQNLIQKGWDVFANPMSTNTYTKEELNNLIQELNSIKPYGVSIVDTLGNMYENDVVNIFKFIDKNLIPQIVLGFHSHNSLQLSFSNTKAILKMGINRTLIIDSCLFGMGRGAGNLCTELITKYINDNLNGNYDISYILNTLTKDIKPIYDKTPWGYSTPFYIAALHGCHPNYAQALINLNYTDEEINKVLQTIPLEHRASFDEKLISK